MKAIILGAGGPGPETALQDNRPKCLLPDPRGARLLDWSLAALRASSVTDVVFVGGYHIEEIGRLYPDLRFCFNPDWQHTNVLASFLFAQDEIADGCVLLYADVVCSPVVVAELVKSGDAEVALVVDRSWPRHAGSVPESVRRKAEEVVAHDDRIVRIGKRIEERTDGEFVGLAWFGPKASAFLRRRYHEILESHPDASFHEAPNLRNAYLTDMIQDLIENGFPVTPVWIEGGWAEVAAPRDLARFVLGSKAETLERLATVVKSGTICPQVRFTVMEWHSRADACLDRIVDAFGGGRLVVRSSARSEDSWRCSMAGAYDSVLDVDGGNPEAVRCAVEAVIAGYHRVELQGLDRENQILVQPQITDVLVSGVMFTAYPQTFAPYIVINYDDLSARTDTVTQGERTVKTAMVFRPGSGRLPDPRLDGLMSAARELEALIGYEALDIEFAISRQHELFILQVRPMVAGDEFVVAPAAATSQLGEIKQFVCESMRPLPHLYGKTTVFADMPDWNPAEMIGTQPNPLAFSLYEYLITDSAWRDARARVGYHDPSPHRLMIGLAGHPYIDVRCSFNNLIPAGLPPDTASRLVDTYLAHLVAHPELHDKVEFEVVVTCLTFDFANDIRHLREGPLSQEDLGILCSALRELTNWALTGEREPIRKQLDLVRHLAPRREQVLRAPRTPVGIPRMVAVLLDDCIRFGTIPFSILARYGFIATSLLRSLRTRGVIATDECDRYLGRIRTVAGGLVEDVSHFMSGILSRDDFLGTYGHLRPGTYDITSWRYDERPDLYLPSRDSRVGERVEEFEDPFEFTPAQRRDIDRLLLETGLRCSANQLLEFIPAAIAGREVAKFEFSKSVSDVLSLLSELGSAYGFAREEMACMRVRDLLPLGVGVPAGGLREYLKRCIESGAEAMLQHRVLHLPPLIVSESDIDSFTLPECRPNFVTGKQITAEGVDLSRETDPDLTGKIVFIENADPGFDWIFVHGIAGLITMYGGAASHMTIRCAEFGLPAAIGCGEALFNDLRTARAVELNCGAGYVRSV